MHDTIFLIFYRVRDNAGCITWLFKCLARFCSFFNQISPSPQFFILGHFCSVLWSLFIKFDHLRLVFICFFDKKLCNNRVSSQTQTWTVTCPQITCLHYKFQKEKQVTIITSENHHMIYFTWSPIKIQTTIWKIQKTSSIFESTQPVSHLTMTHSIDMVVSQSTCKIFYTEFHHVHT